MSKYYNVYAEATVYTRNFVEITDKDMQSAIAEMTALGLSTEDEEDVVKFCYMQGYRLVHDSDIESFEDEEVDVCEEVEVG